MLGSGAVQRITWGWRMPGRRGTGVRRMVSGARLGVSVMILVAALGLQAPESSPSAAEESGATEALAPLYQVLAGWEGRPVGGRLVGAPHAPYAPEARSTVGADRRSLLPLEAEVERRTRRGETGSLRDLSARLRLLGGGLAEAVGLLEEIVASRPEDAVAWNDLAVARLELAAKGGAAELPIRALGAIERALRLAPDLPEARFNRALILERLGLGGRARTEWMAVRDAEIPGAGWAEEAAMRAAALDRPEPRERWETESRHLLDGWREDRADDLALLARELPTAARQLFMRQLLPAWAQGRAAGDAVAAGIHLDQARAVARGLAFSGDRLYVETIAAIDAAVGDQPRLAELAAGHRLFGKANLHYEAWEIAEAERDWKESRQHLEKGESPFALWALFELSRCAYQEFLYDEIVVGLEELLSAVDGRSYTSLEGRALWVLGLTHHVAGRPAEALARFEASLGLFEEADDREGAAIVADLIAIGAGVVGDVEREWSYHLSALAALGNVRESGRRTTICAEAALSAADLGEPHAGSALLDVFLAELDETSDPVEAAVLLRARALTALETGDPEEASGFLETAMARRDKVGSQDVWISLRGDQRALEGWLLSERDPVNAIAALSDAATIFEGTSFGLRQAQVLHQRALVYRKLGDYAAAEQDLLSAAAVRESQRRGIDDLSVRLGHFQLARTVY